MKEKILFTGIIVAVLAGACGPVAVSSGSSNKAKVKTVVLGKGTTTGTPAPAMPGINVPAIKIDTVGYPADWKKVVIFNVDPNGAVVKDDSGKVVLAVADTAIVEKGIDESSKDPTWQVDISSLKAGKYTVQVGDAKSDTLNVGGNIYDKALLAGLKSFYFQRTRCALEKPFAVWEGDAYTRETPSHVHKDVGWDLDFYPKKKNKWKVEGGWHDAGNYDMYVPSTAPSAQTLMMAYEWNPGAFGDKALNIPESGNGIPDILDETKWGIIWVLSVQEDNGAFRHREAIMKWSPEGPADKDKTVRWIAGISSSATAKGVAMAAMASRIYAKYDKPFADRCEKAARKGWEWLKANPKHIRADGKGSPQPLWDDEPDYTDVGARFIAAVEMWRNFRDKSGLETAEKMMDTKEVSDLTEIIKGAWANYSRWGLGTLALDPETPEALRSEAKKRILACADILMEQVDKKDGYRCATPPGDYYWAHNSNLMEKAHILAMAHKLDSTKGYQQGARDQWHWVNGRNPNGYSMTTRVGKGPSRFYHMEWGTKEPPPPGFLLGGPNSHNMGFLAPGAPAKAILWDNPMTMRTGLKPGAMWHWEQSDLWDGGFVPSDEWGEGWWAVTESDILYSANYVLVAVSVK